MITQISPQTAELLTWIFIGLGSAAAVISVVASLWDVFRRKAVPAADCPVAGCAHGPHDHEALEAACRTAYAAETSEYPEPSVAAVRRTNAAFRALHNLPDGVCACTTCRFVIESRRDES